MTVDDRSDEELVRQFKSGDRRAFEAFVRRHQDRIFRLTAVWLDDTQLAGDATQEVFLRAFRGLRRFRFSAAPFTWLYRTGQNVCREFNRKRHPQMLGEEPADTARLPEQQVADLDSARQVRKLVDALPARQREVVLLRIFEDLSVKDTAELMGCRDGTVKALLHKATRRLKIDIDKTGLTL